jgi:carbonic anhydrase
MTKINENLMIYIFLGLIILGTVLFIGLPKETVSTDITSSEKVSGDITSHEKVSEPHWTYEGEEGPENWAELDYHDCAGKEQSPIDIPYGTPLHTNEISFNHNPSVVEISNNGHTIKVAEENKSMAVIDGINYSLQQYHFHAPSEHTLNGTYYDMELHLVHQSDAGKYSVVTVMIKSGSENKAYEPIWEYLPAMKDENKNISSLKIDEYDLLPTNLSYYRYNGSFTTPPCTEGVNFFIMSNPVELSKAQIEAFQAIYPSNNRPIQPLNQREFI